MRTAALLFAVAALAAAQSTPVAIRGGTILPISGAPIPNGTIILRDGKIAAVGSGIPIPAGAEVVDATGKFVMPGLVDAATSLGFAATDLNEPGNSFTPELRAIEAFNPFGTFGAGKPGPIRIKESLSGGITTMYIAPADAAVIGGQGAVVKTAGENLAGLIVREPASIDMALGEPPKKAAASKQRDPATRMAQVAMLRQMLVKAQEYDRNHTANPSAPRDLGMEALVKLLKRELPARLQANSAIDIRSALSVAQEFGFDLIIDGGASAYEHREALAGRKVPVILAQVSHQYLSNDEIPDRSDYPPVDETTAAKLHAAGVKIAIASFSRAFGTLAPAGSSKWLLLDAAIAAGYGLTEAQVLEAVTLSPAQILGVSARVGSLEPGKDADVIVLDGPPLSMKTWVQRVYVGGVLVHQR
ncbi:MAG: amidohydrolase family protein [Acidobacteriia bacterium]|nr:amidohydrolase family protein [Terriglobia bacterium]